MFTGWRIEVLGRLAVQTPERSITRFRTQKTASLLGYLAVHLGKSHPREFLLELLWPESDPKAARLSLNTAVSSLRRQLESPGTPSGSVLQGDRTYLSLNSEVVQTDIGDFRWSLLQGRLPGSDVDSRIRALRLAVDLCRGDLLEGLFDDWILEERQWIEDEYLQALEVLGALCLDTGDDTSALCCAMSAVRADPLRDEGHKLLVRVHLKAGREDEARRHYAEWERIFIEELQERPSLSFSEILDEVARSEAVRPATASASRPALAQATEPGGAPVAEAGESPRSELPVQFTRFFGRNDEIRHLANLLASRETRLLTITGEGGIGKTRLAIETSKRVLPEFGGGVWFVPLVEITDARAIADRVREALHLPRITHMECFDQIAERLGEHRSLLILDNFEQLATEGALAVESLLVRIPDLTLLITSRRRLYVASEREFPLKPLPVPEALDSESPAVPTGESSFTEELMGVPSVQLLVDRVQLARPDFQITPRNAAIVANLCRGLEGIPLAIELAGARAQAMTISQIVDRLSARLSLLNTHKSDRDPRHRSLRAALDWSFDLLSPELRQFFSLLSVFVGGWSTEAAEEVAAESRAAEYLAYLRAHSLVSVRESRSGFRYGMLETLREYAAERLDEKERQAARERHAAWFLRLAEAASSHLEAPEMPEWLSRLHDDEANLHEALEHLRRTSDGARALRLCAAMWNHWQARGLIDEGRGWLGQVLEMPGAAPRSTYRARALNGAGNLAYRQGDHAASIALHEEALSIRRELGDRKGVAGSLGNMANVLTTTGDFDRAGRQYAEAIAIYRELGLKPNEAVSLNNQGRNFCNSGDLQSARASYQEALSIDRSLGHKIWEAYDLAGLSIVEFLCGEARESFEHASEALRIFDEAGHLAGVGLVGFILGRAAVMLGNTNSAQAALRRSMKLHWASGNRQGIAFNLEGSAELGASTGQWVKAATLLGAASRLREEIGAPLPPCFVPWRNSLLARASESIGEGRVRQALVAGNRLDLRSSVALVLDFLTPGC